MELSRLYIYPIKSLAGIEVSHTQMEPKGPAYDRRWMLVAPDGMFLTQRTFADLALFQVNRGDQEWLVNHTDSPSEILHIPMPPYTGQKMQVTIWNDQVIGQQVSTQADAWFSERLGKQVYLVYMPDESVRPINPKYARNKEEVSLADGFPTLMIGEQSLVALNNRLDTPLPMDRFRPNLVFSGGLPHEEDSWETIQIGDITFRGAKPCVRCVVTTIDQQTAKKGVEPLKTLSTYRRRDHKIYFGMNLLHDRQSRLEVGMPISVLSRQTPVLPLPAL